MKILSIKSDKKMPSKRGKGNRSSKEEKGDRTTSGFDEISFGVYRFIHEPNRLLIMAQLYALEQADMLYLKKTLKISHHTTGRKRIHHYQKAVHWQEIIHIVTNNRRGKSPF
jgi:hypothetical protein